jgi:hypothetical protein
VVLWQRSSRQAAALGSARRQAPSLSSTSRHSACPAVAATCTPGTEQGLFFVDTRLLSRYELTIDGESVEPLTVSLEQPFATTFVAQGKRDAASPTARFWYCGDRGIAVQLPCRRGTKRTRRPGRAGASAL